MVLKGDEERSAGLRWSTQKENPEAVQTAARRKATAKELAERRSRAATQMVPQKNPRALAELR
jgi:hypothetical protein